MWDWLKEKSSPQYVHTERTSIAIHARNGQALRLRCLSPDVSVVVNLATIFLLPNGEEKVFSRDFIVPKAATITTFYIPVTNSVLPHIVISIVEGSVILGQVLVALDLISNANATGLILHTICSGLISPSTFISYPSDNKRSESELFPFIVDFNLVPPAPNAQYVLTVPNFMRYRLLSCITDFTTDAVAGFRCPHVYILNGAIERCHHVGLNGIDPGNTLRSYFTCDSNYVVIDDTAYESMSHYMLANPGEQFIFDYMAGDIGDTWAQLTISFERLLLL